MHNNTSAENDAVDISLIKSIVLFQALPKPAVKKSSDKILIILRRSNRFIFSGYGTSKSWLEQTPAEEDEGVVFTCVADVPARKDALTITLPLAFCE
jgi:hypothetical protein